MNELKKKKILTWLSLSLFAAFAISLGWGIYEYKLLIDQKNKTENQYKRALNDLSADLNETDISMSKARIANSPAQKVLYLSEIWKGSDSAANKLGQLPADEVGISYVGTLMNQVGDFTKTMTRKVAAEGVMTAEEEKTFDEMHERVIEVNRAVQQLSTTFYTQNLSWVDKQPGLLQKLGIGKSIQTSAQGGEQGAEDNQRQETRQNISSVRGGLKQLDASLQKYPPLDYQGELDKHYVEKPLGLPSGEISDSKAVQTAADFLKNIGYEGAEPKITSLSQSPLGGFNLTYKDAYVEVSKRGGVVTFFRDQREIGERQLDVKRAVDKAYATLGKLGWNLVVTSTEDLDSYIQVEAVPEQDKVRLYPDKIRLTIALDNGQVVGFDANPYYAYHHKRDLEAVLTLDQAKAKLSKNLNIIENRLAVISKLGTEEAFCYEFRGTALGEEYLIYINAKDGSEEKISRIITTPRGKLIQ